MSWRKNLLDASFREVPFKVKRSEYTGGRRYTTRHRYKTTPLVYDLGPYDEDYKIEAIITQTYENDFDYFRERDNLIWALSEEGTGELVHPYLGVIQVQVAGDFKMEESFDEGGVAKFSLTFMKVPIDENVKAFQDAFEDIVDIQVDLSISLIADYFQQFLSAAAFIQNTINDAIALVNGIQSKISQVQNAISATLSAALGAFANIISLIDFVVGTPCDMVRLFTDAADQFKGICGLAGEINFTEALGGCSGKTKSQLTGGDTGDTQTLDGNTIPQGLGKSVVVQMIAAALLDDAYLTEQNDQAPETVQLNRDLMLNASAANLIGAACQIAIRIDFDSEEEMISVRDTITDAINTVLLSMGEQEEITTTMTDDSLVLDNTDAIIALENIQAVFFKAITQKNSDLNKTLVYTVPAGVQSALELSYNLYEDISRVKELHLRNRKLIGHPGFLPGDTNINVLEQ